METVLLLQWWNLVYLLPFTFGFLLLLMQAAGVAGKDFELSVDGEAALELEADLDAEVDLDAELPADLEVDADAELDAGDLDGPPEAELESESALEISPEKDLVLDGGDHVELSVVWKAASLLGVGKVPLSMLLMNFCFTWGGFGLSLNMTLRPLLPDPLFFFPLSLVGTVLLSAGTTSLLSRFLATYLPSTSTTSSRNQDLVGCVGRTLYRIRPGREGTIRVRDRHGNHLQFAAFQEGEEEIAGGTEVLLVRYASERRAFEVEVAPTELRRDRPS